MLNPKTMSKFFKDILRDKGSTKYSITKTLALVTFIFMIAYLSMYLFFLKKPIDHTILLELIGFDVTLLGLKNNWGVRSKTVEPTNAKVLTFEKQPDHYIEDEGVF